MRIAEQTERNHAIIRDKLGFNEENKKYSFTDLVVKYKLSQTRLQQILKIHGDEICPEDGAILPEPRAELRDGGNMEIVQICPTCGATYTSR